jgi:hypothetical protein
MDNLDHKQIRITIKWTDLLLTLGACAGNLVVEILNIPPTETIKSKLLLTARIKIERNSYGYENAEYFNGLTHNKFDKYIYPTVTRMMKSYHKGMLLSKLDYDWIDHWGNN